MYNFWGDKLIMFSGFNDDNLQSKLESKGAKFSNSIDNINLLITGEHLDLQNHFSGKLKIAMSNGVKIIDRDSIKNI